MESILEALKKIPNRKKAFLAVLAAGLTLAGWLTLRLAYNSDFEVLYASLSAEDAGKIVAKLKEAKVDYKLEAGGTMVMVPSARVDELRLSLASQGIPSSGGTGFELFDKTKLMSGFAEKVQFRRALEGELARTLSRMEGVKMARVHLAIPEPTPFVTEQAVASASIILHLAGGAALSASQIRGVVHLVSGAVEGLSPDRVSVLDGMGKLLHSGSGDDGGASAQDLKSAIEKNLEARGQDLLDRLYGRDKAVVRVDVAMDMDKLQSVREVYDPQTNFVRSSREVSGQSGGSGSKSSNTEKQTSYELNKRVETFVKSPGGLKKLSVAVLINDPKAPQEQVDKIKLALSAALGVDETRGDKLTVETLPFAAVPAENAQEAKDWAKENGRSQLVRDLLRYGSLMGSALIIAAGLVLAMKLAAPLLAAAPEAAPAPAASVAAAAAAAAAAPAAPARPAASGRAAQLALTTLAAEKPEVFSRAFKKYMNSPAAGAGSPQKEAANVN